MLAASSEKALGSAAVASTPSLARCPRLVVRKLRAIVLDGLIVIRGLLLYLV